MSILQSIVLGIVQGLTEFIPVSSSGHLDLLPKILGWTTPPTAYITFLHLGTLVALIFFFRKKLLKYAKALVKVLKRDAQRTHEESENLQIILNIVIASIPAGVIGFLFEKFISDFYDSAANTSSATLLTISAMATVGIIFLFVHKFFRVKKYDLGKLKYSKAFIIGISQTFAFIRGTSRSGITLITGQALGLKRVAAAEFAFLMSIPIITVTSLYGTYQLFHVPQEELDLILLPSLVGFLCSFLFGVLAIRFLINFLKSNSLVTFGLYRILFALFALLILFS